VAWTIGRDRLALADLEGVGDEALQSEAVNLEVRRVRDRREEVHVEVVDAVRGHREVVRLRRVSDLRARPGRSARGGATVGHGATALVTTLSAVSTPRSISGRSMLGWSTLLSATMAGSRGRWMNPARVVSSRMVISWSVR
jgi:hypothetical protein